MSDAPGPFALFLDFDGTLVDIAERPDAVRVDDDLPGALGTLATRLDGALAIVSGRTIEDVSSFLPGLALDVCGMHGLEQRVGGVLSRPEGLADLGPEIEDLRRAFVDRPGVLVESKRIGVALHWRRAPDAEAEAMAAMAALAARLGPGYRVQDGKCVREIVPAASGKGGAIRRLMDDAPYRGRRPLFAGDDRTDEDGFRAVNAMRGLSVKIGDGETAANRRSASAGEFRRWLMQWADGRSDPSKLVLA